MGNMSKLPRPTMKPAAVTIVSLAVVSAALAQENAAKWPRALELENATVVRLPNADPAQEQAVEASPFRSVT